MKGKQFSCSFTGHRPTKLPWGYREDDPRCIALKERIFDAVEAAYAEGYTHFLCGMAQGCDMYFGEAVLALKERCSDVTLEAVIPCPEQTQNWPASARARHERIVEAADLETLVSEKYTADCMYRRNRYLVDHASLLVAVYDGLPGGTMQTITYAMNRGISIVDIPVGAMTEKENHEG